MITSLLTMKMIMTMKMKTKKIKDKIKGVQK
uniref:Uncharacterized protein n=1 Tax=Siphoviridae sp. ctLqe90 TaxID=2825456 RepID=A0A8S5Q322_9CAUD|nr:MAG TPA: hypothetical protein [Siphoviridae sp. ctLqe90]